MKNPLVRPSHRFGRLTVRSLVLSLVVVGLWHGTRLATESPAPTIKVRWSNEVSERERKALEQRFQLLRPDPSGPNAYYYDLLDSRQKAIRAIVEHPAVADTQNLDRSRFTVTVLAGRGESNRWLWHRYGPEWAARWVATALHGWLALSLIAWVMWEEKRPIESDTAA